MAQDGTIPVQTTEDDCKALINAVFDTIRDLGWMLDKLDPVDGCPDAEDIPMLSVACLRHDALHRLVGSLALKYGMAIPDA